MSDPNLSWPDLRSIRAAAEQAELGDNPGQGRGRTMTVFAAAPDGYRTNATNRIDHAIRLPMAAAVLAVVGIAAVRWPDRVDSAHDR